MPIMPRLSRVLTDARSFVAGLIAASYLVCYWPVGAWSQTNPSPGIPESGVSSAGCLAFPDPATGTVVSGIRTWRQNLIQGKPPIIATCTPSKAAGTAAMTLDASHCPVLANDATQTVSQQVTTSYVDGLGRAVVTQRCLPMDQGKTWPMVQSMLNCAATHQFDISDKKGTSTFAKGGYYLDGGKTHLATACTDPQYLQVLGQTGVTAVSVRHELVQCGAFRARNGDEYHSYRVDLVLDGSDPLVPAGRQTLIGCQPMPEFNPGVTVSYSCQSTLFHSAFTHTSFMGRQLMHRVRDEDGNSRIVPLTGCVADPAHWVPQQLVTLGYINDDANLLSWPQMQWQALVNATTIVPVGQPETFPIPVPYIASSYQLIGNTQARLLCARWLLQDVMTIYTRADASQTDPLFDHPFTPRRLDSCSASATAEQAAYANDLKAFTAMQNIAASAGLDLVPPSPTGH